MIHAALLALALAVASAAFASEIRATKDFADVAAVVDQYVEQFGAQHVLLVLDIDNTIMSMDHDLGSDHWFEWQNYLLKNEPDSKYLVADTFDGLLEVQGVLYNHGHMHPPQSDLPAIIAKMQKRGIATLLLTSRGPEFRAYTERELARCGYDFAATALPLRDAPRGPFLAYDPARPEKDGLTHAEIVRFKLEQPRPATYADGVFMTSGQHKGIMLLTMLNDSPLDIKAVVFVDDNVRHVGSVFTSAVGRNIEATVFQYQHEDLRAQRFQYGDKRNVTERWRALQRSIDGPVVSTSRPQPAPQGCNCCPPRRRLRVRF